MAAVLFTRKCEVKGERVDDASFSHEARQACGRIKDRANSIGLRFWRFPLEKSCQSRGGNAATFSFRIFTGGPRSGSSLGRKRKSEKKLPCTEYMDK